MLVSLYPVTKPVPMFQVVYRNPLERDRSGRAKRIRKHFLNREDAEKYQRDLNEQLLKEGAAGVRFTAVERNDAIAARGRLDRAGYDTTSLLALADAFVRNMETKPQAASPDELQPLIDAFLADKRDAEGCSERTVGNLRVRVEKWAAREKVDTVAGVVRERVESLRVREGVSPQTRRNDINAVSSFCTWLLDKGKIDHHPLKGLRRPKVPMGAKATFTADQCAALLKAATDYAGGKWLGTIATMLFTGVRPSELEETHLFYGRHPMARIEGGKLRGRANRTIPLSTAAAAWLRAAGNPTRVEPLNSKARQRLCERAGLTWTEDVTRHTFISNRVSLAQNDAQVAREAGTSEEIIFRHYHRLTMPPEARRWAKLRPGIARLTKLAEPANVPARECPTPVDEDKAG